MQKNLDNQEIETEKKPKNREKTLWFHGQQTTTKSKCLERTKTKRKPIGREQQLWRKEPRETNSARRPEGKVK